MNTTLGSPAQTGEAASATASLALEAGGNLADVATDTGSIAGDTTSIDGKITACNTGAVVLAAGTALVGKFSIDQSTANANEVVVKSGSVTADLGANNDVTVTSGAITETNSGAIKTAVEKIDDAISGSEMQVDVVAALPAGTNLLGQVSLSPQTANGTSIFRSIDLDESEEEVKGSAGNIYGWYMMNKNAATLFLKFYNDTAANVTVGTTTPVITIPVPTGSAANVAFPNGISFSTAITVAVTTGVADNDTGAPAANDFIINLMYK